MEVIARKKIDLSSYNEGDLEFYYPRCAQLVVEVENVASIVIQGRNIMSDNYYTLPIVKQSNYDIVSNINGSGIYTVDVTSVDKVKLVTTDVSGIVFLKMIGG